MVETDNNKKKRKAENASAGLNVALEVTTPSGKKKKRVAEAGNGDNAAVDESKPSELDMLEAYHNKKKRKAAKASADLNGAPEAEALSGKKKKNRVAEAGSGDAVAVDEAKAHGKKKARMQGEEMQDDEAVELSAAKTSAALAAGACQKKKHGVAHAASETPMAGVVEESVEDMAKPHKKEKKRKANIEALSPPESVEDMAKPPKKEKKRNAKVEALSPPESVEDMAKPPKKEKKRKAKVEALSPPESVEDMAKPHKKEKKRKAKVEALSPPESVEDMAKPHKKEKKRKDVADTQPPAYGKTGNKNHKEFASAREMSTPASPAAELSRSKSFSNSELRLFVSGIPRDCDEAVLRKDFEECGEVTNLKLLLDKDGLSRGIAFITYKDEAGFQAALAYDRDAYNGGTLRIKKAEAKGAGTGTGFDMGPKPEGCNSIVLKKLPLDVVSEDLHEFFQHCNGGPKYVGLLTDRNTGKSRGTARVDFNSSVGVDEAVKLLGTKLKGQPLVMSYCQPKSW